MARADIRAAQQTELDKIIALMEEQAGIAEARTLGREATATAIYDEIIARYGPGGAYGRGAEALLERQKIGDVGAGAQRLISAGLYGTEVGGGLERAWEAEVGAPARLRLEDIKMERLSQAQLGKAGFVERIEDVGPDYGMMMQYLSQAANVPIGVGGGVGGYGGAGAGAVTPRREFGWSGFPEEPTPSAGGYAGALWGREPVTGGMRGPGGEELIAPTPTTMEDWLAQGYTGYGPAFEGEAEPSIADADTAAWQRWEAARQERRRGQPMATATGNLYPTAAAWKKAAQRGVL